MPDFESQAARDAQARSYGSERYWSYLDEACTRSRDHWLGRGDTERANHMMTRSLGEALAGNDGI